MGLDCKCSWIKLIDDELEKYEQHTKVEFVIDEVDYTVFTLDRRSKGEYKSRAGDTVDEDHAGSSGSYHNQGVNVYEDKGIVTCKQRGWLIAAKSTAAQNRWMQRGQREFKAYAKGLGYVPSGSQEMCFKQVAKYNKQGDDMRNAKYSKERRCGDEVANVGSCNLTHSIPQSILAKMSDETFKAKCPFAWLYLKTHRGGNRFKGGEVPVQESKNLGAGRKQLHLDCAEVLAYCIAADAKDQAPKNTSNGEDVGDDGWDALQAAAAKVSLEEDTVTEESDDDIDGLSIKSSKAQSDDNVSMKKKKATQSGHGKNSTADASALTPTKHTQRTSVPKPKASGSKKVVIVIPVPLSKTVDPAQSSDALNFAKNDKSKQFRMDDVEAKAKKWDAEHKLKKTQAIRNRQGDVSSDSDGRLHGEQPITMSDVNVASQHRVFFEGVSMKFLDPADGPNFEVSESSSAWSSVGDVAVKSKFDLSFSFFSKTKGGVVKGSLTVADLGEKHDGQSRQCETIATAAALRVPVSVVREQQIRDMKKWQRHHKKEGLHGSRLYQALEDQAVAAGVSQRAASLESEAVTNILSRSQPLAPFWGLMALGDYAHDVGQLHVFVDGRGEMEWLLGVPLTYKFDGSTNGMPIVTKVYSDTHASVGIWNHLQVHDRIFECHESLRGVTACSGTWLTVGDLLAAHKEINLQFTFKVSLAVSMDEKLKRRHYDGVPSYVRQPMQVGNEDFKDEVGEVGGEVKVEDSKHEGLFHSVGFAGPKDVATLQEVMEIEEMLRMSQSSWQEAEFETEKTALD